MRLHNLLITLLLTAATLNAGCGPDPYHLEWNDRDFPAAEEFIYSKRTIPAMDKWGEFKFLGDFKTDLLNSNNFLGSDDVYESTVLRERGGLISHVTIEAQLNLRTTFKSCNKKTWAHTHVAFGNQWGIFDNRGTCEAGPHQDKQGLFGSGDWSAVDLKMAYFGWNFYDYKLENGDVKFIFEIGRRKLYKMFESFIQFNSTSDGVLFKVDRVFKPDWLVYGKVLGFVVDERVNHLAYVAEIGTLDFFETKWDYMVSFIDWGLLQENRCLTPHPKGASFRNVQFATAYNFPKETFGRKTRLYGAFLINTAGKDVLEFTPLVQDPENPLPPAKSFGKQNLGWYAGMIIGEVKKAGEWSFDARYEYVESMAVPSGDVFGIGRGVTFKNAPTIDGYGNANYKGFRLEALVALTKCYYIDLTYSMSWTIDPRVGRIQTFRDVNGVITDLKPSRVGTGSLRYNQFECALRLEF